jgi:hypothetical protein
MHQPLNPWLTPLADLMHQRRLADMGKQSNLLGKDADGNEQGLTQLVDGAVPSSLMREVQRIYREVEGIDSWSKWY